MVALFLGHQSIEDVTLLTPLLVGACVAVCTANDSSQDYKTMQFCGVRPSDGFTAQLLGLVAGCVVVPISLWIAHNAYTLGSDALPAPQGVMFATLVDGLLLQEALPWAPIIIGLAVGAAAVTMDVVAGKRGHQLPSMALAVGIYLPPYLGVGILLGAIFRWLGERGGIQRHESILAAAGLITGAAALDLILGVLVIAGVDLEALLKLFGTESELDGQSAADVAWRLVPESLTSFIGLAGILVLGGLLSSTRAARPPEGRPPRPGSRSTPDAADGGRATAMKLSILMPVFNEQETLRAIVERVLATPWEKELILIDDGSSDGTPALLRELEAEHDEIQVRVHPQNRGKGAALATGLSRSPATWC